MIGQHMSGVSGGSGSGGPSQGGDQPPEAEYEEVKKDLVSWNSMIAGYAQYGLAEEAIELLNEMKELKINPDAITFLGVLSSCCHAGLVEYGHYLFQFNGSVWSRARFRPLLMLHGEVLIGIEAAENRLLLVPSCTATHVQLVKLYANAGRWEQVARVRKLMNDRGLKTYPGCSWIEIKNEVYKFRAEDRSNARVDEILAVVDSLIDNMRRFSHVRKYMKKSFDVLANACLYMCRDLKEVSQTRRFMRSLPIRGQRVWGFSQRESYLVKKNPNSTKLTETQYGVEPELDHNPCIVDLISRAGLVKEAKELINEMPVCPNAGLVVRLYRDRMGCRKRAQLTCELFRNGDPEGFLQ
ncbi:hypothetical protein IFM89_031965 [Coptis chinensis]|uniref:Pentatricopeptide repeat-containing protein n=1 Tax=Coptis chinensis TaxID=261450 RepID=A0A835HGP2_9MAGN|nr:hypothetical protein IFM89_031965 [Coptis chinensis]